MSAATQGTVFEGHHTTVRTVAMIQAARRIWHHSPNSHGKPHPVIRQGGYNRGGVAASGGTHDKDAVDFSTGYLDNMENRLWEKCLRLVGFKAWWRQPIPGVWGEHCHAIPEGGDLSSAAQVQVKAFHAGRNGLRSNLHDPTIGGLSHRTWEQYKKLHTPKPLPKVRIGKRLVADVPYVSLERIRQAYNTGERVMDVRWFQHWLWKRGYYKAPRDGVYGPVTQLAWKKFVKANELDDPGLPNWVAFQLLAKRARTTKPIRRK